MNSPFKQAVESSGSSVPEKQHVQGRLEGLEAGPTETEQAHETAATKATIIKSDRAADRQKQEIEKLSGLTSLDWKNIPPPMLAQLLVNIPFKGATGEPDFYLQPWQA